MSHAVPKCVCYRLIGSDLSHDNKTVRFNHGVNASRSRCYINTQQRSKAFGFLKERASLTGSKRHQSDMSGSTAAAAVVVTLVMWLVRSVRGDCTMINSCSCQSDKGVIDLSPLSASSGPAFKDLAGSDGWLYSWNPCKEFTEKTCKTVSAVQLNSDKSLCYSIGTQDSAFFATVTGSDDVMLMYTATDAGTYRTTQVTLKCDPTVDSKLDVLGEQNYAIYYMTLTSKYCCAGYVNVEITASLSVGSILLIVFVALLVVYLVAGVIVQKAVRKATGKEVIPNYSLWSSIPGLIKDGAKFTFSCGRSSYSKI